MYYVYTKETETMVTERWLAAKIKQEQTLRKTLVYKEPSQSASHSSEVPAAEAAASETNLHLSSSLELSSITLKPYARSQWGNKFKPTLFNLARPFEALLI